MIDKYDKMVFILPVRIPFTTIGNFVIPASQDMSLKLMGRSPPVSLTLDLTIFGLWENKNLKRTVINMVFAL